MLRRLFIQNFATIKKQVVEFENGFIAITGETGAGKSIFVKAIKIILGEKCSKEFIRSGENSLMVEAEFELSESSRIEESVASVGIDFESSLVIRRKVSKSGKNEIFINDCSVNLNTLLKIGKYLVDLNGQHSQQSLLQPSTHIDYYDDFLKIKEQVHDFGEKYHHRSEIQKKVEHLQGSAAENNREADFLRFQIQEIENSKISEAEFEELNQEYKVLNNAEKLKSVISPIAEWVDAGGSPLEQVSSAIYSLEELVQYDNRLEKIITEMKSGFIIIEEAIQELSHYSGMVEANPLRLDEINQRLAQLDQLKRKYGANIVDILNFLESQKQKLSSISSSDEKLQELEKKLSDLNAELLKSAKKLSDQRMQKKRQFEGEVISHLKELGLEKSQFEVSITRFHGPEKIKLNPKGQDQVEFLITTNPGHPLKPLTKVASGGELSRILLAVKSVVRSEQATSSLIFDEIDTGISGRISEIVGNKLNRLGREQQVICITHSPQIASIAGAHYRVEKEMKKKEAITCIVKLEASERVDEIAQFLSGNEISEKTRLAAEEMLKIGGE